MALPMPDDVIDKLHRMARQQKNKPGLIFADRNLDLDEYDDDKDDEMYKDDNSSGDEDKEVLNYDEEEDNDVDEDEEEAHGPPVGENDDDVDDDNNEGDAAGEADVQQLAEAEQPVNPPGETTGVGAANQGEENDEAVFPEIEGVDEDVTELETPGVGLVEESEEGKNEEDQPTEDVATGQLPPAPPHEDDSTEERYNLRNNLNHNYGPQYAGKDFIVDSMAITTHGSGEVLETPQMSLKAGLLTFRSDSMRAVEKEMCQLYNQGVMMPVHKKCLMPEQWKEALAYLMFLKWGNQGARMCRRSETEGVHCQGRINSTHGQHGNSVSNCSN